MEEELRVGGVGRGRKGGGSRGGKEKKKNRGLRNRVPVVSQPHATLITDAAWGRMTN